MSMIATSVEQGLRRPGQEGGVLVLAIVLLLLVGALGAAVTFLVETSGERSTARLESAQAFYNYEALARLPEREELRHEDGDAHPSACLAERAGSMVYGYVGAQDCGDPGAFWARYLGAAVAGERPTCEDFDDQAGWDCHDANVSNWGELEPTDRLILISDGENIPQGHIDEGWERLLVVGLFRLRGNVEIDADVCVDGDVDIREVGQNTPQVHGEAGYTDEDLGGASDAGFSPVDSCQPWPWDNESSGE